MAGVRLARGERRRTGRAISRLVARGSGTGIRTGTSTADATDGDSNQRTGMGVCVESPPHRAGRLVGGGVVKGIAAGVRRDGGRARGSTGAGAAVWGVHRMAGGTETGGSRAILAGTAERIPGTDGAAEAEERGAWVRAELAEAVGGCECEVAGVCAT